MKSKSYLLIPLLAALLTACASNVEPLSLGGERYSMTYTVKDGVDKDGEALTKIIGILQGICEEKGKKAKFIEAENDGMPVLDPQTNRLTFVCVENG